MATRIYGHSDDCIEFECGDEREEWSLIDGAHLHFADGLVVACTFNAKPDEAWRFAVVKNPGGVKVDVIGPNDDDDTELLIHADYTEPRLYDGADGPSDDFMREAICRFIDDGRMGDLSGLAVKHIYGAMYEGRVDD